MPPNTPSIPYLYPDEPPLDQNFYFQRGEWCRLLLGPMHCPHPKNSFAALHWLKGYATAIPRKRN